MSFDGGSGSAGCGGLAAAAAGLTAACGVLGLVALQTDELGRRFLAPDRLHAKRHAEYGYRWTTAAEKASWSLRHARFAGGGSRYSEDEELLQTTFVKLDSDIDDLVKKIVNSGSGKSSRNKSNSTSGGDQEQAEEEVIRVGQIFQDETSVEYYACLLEGNRRIYQVPLTTFVEKLADAFERKVTSTTFCFVVDASAGIASELVVDMVRDVPALKEQVLTVEQPLWLVNLAQAARRRNVSEETLKKTLFACARMEALRCASHSQTTCILTVGTALAPFIMPLAYRVFNNDRQVFAYTGCCNTVGYARDAIKFDPGRGYVPSSLEKALHFTERSIVHTTPFAATVHKSVNTMKPFRGALAELPLHEAGTTETWMGAIDSFFVLKHEKNTEFLPYVFKLDYLLEKSLDQYLSLRSLLQYVTGSRSREVPKDTMNAALSWLVDYLKILPSPSSPPAPAMKKLIENTVFQHKLILIENKTLQDTVQPAEHWTLKQAMKRGCACCAPEDDEDEDEEGEQVETPEASRGFSNTFLPQPKRTKTIASGGASGDAGAGGSRSPARPAKGGYVDGKTVFAFDPSKFST